MKMFGIDKTLNPNIENDMFVTFECWTAPVIRYLTQAMSHGEPYDFSQSKRIGGYKVWMPHEEIKELIQHTYGTGASVYDEMASETMGTIAAGMRYAYHANPSTGGTKGPIYDAPKIWKEVNRRQFDMNIALFAHDDLDKDVYDVIRFFRNNSYPTRINDHAIASELTIGTFNTVSYPPYWRIGGGPWRFINNRQNYFSLEEVEVTYAGKVKLVRQGYPLEANLRLKFVEAIPMTKDMFDETNVNIMISQRNTTNTGFEGAGGIENGKKQEIARIIKRNTITNPSTQSPGLKASYNTNLSTGDTVGADVEPLLVNWSRKVPPITSIAPSKGVQQVTGAPTAGADSVVKAFLKQQILPHGDIYSRLVGNLERRVITLVQTKISQIIQESRLFKKITSITDIDPVLRAEVLSKLKKVRIAKFIL